MPWSALRPKTMFQGIFDQRLKNQRWNVLAGDFGSYIDSNLETISKTGLLN